MMKFYVNELNDHKLREQLGITWPNNIVALFGEHKWKGEGSCCGWYGVEYFLDTKVYAYYIAETAYVYNPNKRVSEVTVCDPCLEYEKVAIGSCYWTTEIKANSVEEAVEKFKKFYDRSFEERNGEWKATKF